MAMKLWLACACVFLLSCCPATGMKNGGANGGSPEDREVDTFVLGNVVWTLYHEIGHALVHMLELPVVGREEDAVDGFGVVRMIAALPGNDSEALLVEAARGWRLFHDDGEARGLEGLFWGEHSLDLQRHYDVLCLLAGSDPEGRRQLAIDAGLPEERVDECPGEYESMREGWERLLAPHAPNGGAVASRVRSRGPGDIKVKYGMAWRNADDRVRTLIKESGLVEAAVEDVLSLVELPRNLKVRFADCKYDAFFDTETFEVGFCYRYAAQLRSFVRNDIAQRSEGAAEEEAGVFFPDLTFDEELAALFVLGNAQFAVYHGLAKALIHDLDLPFVVGEANAADSFAAVLMIPDGPGDPLADELVFAAANGLYLAGLALGEDSGAVVAWSGDDANLQRFYDVLCLFVGSDLEGLRKTGKVFGLPGGRARQCEIDYEKAAYGWNELLELHAPESVSGSGAIDVVFEEASGEGNRNLTDLVRDSGVVEEAVDYVLSLVDLPRDLQVVIKDCEGEADGEETFFDEDGGRVVVCHKFLARLEALIKDELAEESGR